MSYITVFTNSIFLILKLVNVMVIVDVFQILVNAFSHVETWLMDHTVTSVSPVFMVVHSMEPHVSVRSIFFYVSYY